MKHCPELKNSSELGEDVEGEWRVCVRGVLEEVLEVEERGDNDDGQTRGSPPSIKAAGM